MTGKGTKRGRDCKADEDNGRHGSNFLSRQIDNKSHNGTHILPYIGIKNQEKNNAQIDAIEPKLGRPQRSSHSMNQLRNEVPLIQDAVKNPIQTNTKQIFSQLGPSDQLPTTLVSSDLSNATCRNYGDSLFQDCLDPKLMDNTAQNYLFPSCEKTKLTNINQHDMLNGNQISLATIEGKTSNEKKDKLAHHDQYSTLQPHTNVENACAKNLNVNNGEINLMNGYSQTRVSQSNPSLLTQENEQLAPLMSFLTAQPYGNIPFPPGNSGCSSGMHASFVQAKISTMGMPQRMLPNPNSTMDKQFINFGFNSVHVATESGTNEATQDRDMISLLNSSSQTGADQNYHQNLALVNQNDLLTKLQEKECSPAAPTMASFENFSDPVSLPSIRGNIPGAGFNSLINAKDNHTIPLSNANEDTDINSNTASNPHQRHGSIDLYMRCDDDILSAHQILIRKQIEYFEAGTQEVQSVAHGRKKEIRMGQVGLRCKHCAGLPIKRRPRGAVYYPTSLRALYQAAQNMAVGHFVRSCELIDEEVKQQLKTFQESKASAGHGGKKYWADCAKALDIIETEREGLRFNRSDT